MTSDTVTRAGIERAYHSIAPMIRRTPVIEVAAADLGLDPGLSPVVLKLEQLQHSGSFKARGAVWSLLSQDVPAVGVVTASGGNHGAALAFAARRAGVPCTVFAFRHSPDSKVALIRSFGAEVHRTADDFDSLMDQTRAHAASTGALLVHAYDETRTLEGQGTVALEFFEQSAVDTLLVATGGGGLIGGVAAWVEDRAHVVSVEPEAAPSLHAALAAGRPVPAPAGGIAADSLGPVSVGRLMFPIAQRYIDRAVLVPDSAIRDAQRRLWDAVRIVAEPGGAAALAALLSGVYRPAPEERVGVLICGANTGAVSFPD